MSSAAGAADRGRGRGLLLPFLLLLPLLAGCPGAGSRSGAPAPGIPDVPPPSWALTGTVPDSPGGKVCAIGMAGPTYFRSDGVEAAADKARGELARTIQVRISTASLDIQRSAGGGTTSQTVVEVSSAVNRLVLEGSKIAEVWYDPSGRGFAHRPRCTYALVCIDGAALPHRPAPPRREESP